MRCFRELLLIALTLTLTWSSVCSQSTESLTSDEMNAKPVENKVEAKPVPSSPTSLLSGLLGTITSTSTSKNCPGTCVHVFASLLCDRVLDSVKCAEPSMRCCVNRPAGNRTDDRNSHPRPTRPMNRISTTIRTTTTTIIAKADLPDSASEATSIEPVATGTADIATDGTVGSSMTTASPTTLTETTMQQRTTTTTTKTTTTQTTTKPTTTSTTTKATTTTTPTTTKPTTTTRTATPTTTTTPATTTTTRTTTTVPPATTKQTTTTTTTPATTTQSKVIPEDETIPTESSEDADDLKNGSPSLGSALRVCPGVCVATRISDYCEAVLNVEGFCKAQMRCCVTKSLFGDSDHPPELVILNEGSSPATLPTSTKLPASTTTSTTISTSTPISTSTVTTTRPTTTTQIVTQTTTRPKPRTTTETAPIASSEKQCKGDCITGFFQYLCLEPDYTAVCENRGRCCNPRKNSPDGRPSQNGTQSRNPTPQRTTTSRPATTTRPATTRPATTRPESNRPAPTRPVCQGTCLPGLMSHLCTGVIVRSPENLCERGSSCCDSKSKQESVASPPSQNPLSTILSIASLVKDNPALATMAVPFLTSMLGNNNNNNKPEAPRPPPPRRPDRPQAPQAIPVTVPTTIPTTTMSTTTTTTTTTAAPQVVDSRPFCPGTCITPILSFTCFSNAEVTDLFRCQGTKVVCCAPKSVINAMKPAAPTLNLPQTEFPNGRPEKMPFVRPGTAVVTPQPHSVQTDRPSAPSKPVTHNKFVCGVKGTQRESRSVADEGNATLSTSVRRGRVVGGFDSLPGEFCWQVALINSLNQYLCGAALIGTQWVLTAAHCVTNIVRSGDAIYVRVGDHDLTSRYGSPGAQTLRVATTYIHHNHNSQTLDNDIALLKLQGQAELKTGVCIICLPTRGSTPETGRRCTVTGYGYMGENGPIPLRVREAEVPVVSESECVRQINAVTEKIFIMPASSFCAGGESGNDACQGDGGGPLACEDEGYYELTGLVSWGFGCGRSSVPGVYVKVSNFISWINQIISVNNV